MERQATEKDAEAARKEQNEAEGKHVGFKIFKYADSTDKVLLAIGATTALLSGVGMPAYSQIQGKIIGKISSTDNDIYSTMSTLALALVVTGGVMMLLQGIRGYCVSFSSMRQTTRIKYFYFQALMRQEVAWHDQHPPGELTSRMDGDIKVIERALGENIMASLQHIGTIGFGFGVAFYNGWELTLFMLGAMPFIAIVSALMGRVMLKATTQTREGYAKAGAIALEAIDNVKTVQVFGREDFETDRFAKAVAPTVPAGIRKEFATYVTTGVNDFVLYVVYGLGFWFGAYLIRWGRNSISEVITIFFSALTASYAIGRLSPCLSTFLEGAGAAGKIFAVIDRLPAMDCITKPEGYVNPATEPFKIEGGEPVMDVPRPIGLSLPDGKFQHAITFKEVAFSYPTRSDDKLFTKLNLTITKGQTVAFSGASGSGKSSIVGLVQRFYDPTEGSVSVDGIDLKDLNLRAWRDCISIVSQEPKLFTGTVAENVKIGKPDATIEDVIAACTKAHVNHVIEALPNKYDTLVGTGGSQLSGGQKQRVAIARALLRKPQILILDEATSALDRKSEVEVQAALEDVMFGSRLAKEGLNDDPLTVIVIAHRLATIRNADVIHYINHDGEQGSWIEESGSYDDLINLNGHFAAMTRKQVAAPAADSPRSDAATKSANAISVLAKEDPTEMAFDATPADSQPSEDSDDEKLSEEEKKKKAELRQRKKEAAADDDEDAPLYAEARLKTLKEADEEGVRNTPSHYLRVLGMCSGTYWAIILGVIGCFIAGIDYPAYAVMLSYVLEVLARVDSDERVMRDEIPGWCSAFFAVAVCALVSHLMIGCFAIVGERLTLKLRRALFYSILRQDMTFFDTPGRDSSALATILSTDAEVIHGLWGPSAGSKIQVFTTLVAGIVISMYYSWRCGLVVISLTPVFFIAIAICTVLLKAFGAKDDLGLKAEALTNIRTVIALNLQDTMVGKYAEHIIKLEAKQKYNAVVLGINGALMGFLIYGLMAMVSWYSGKLISDGTNTFLEVMVAQQAIMMGVRGIAEAGQISSKFKDASAAAQRVFYIIDREPPIAAIPKVDLDVDFDSNGARIYKNCSAKANDTELTAIGSKGDKNVFAGLLSVVLNDLRFRYPARLEAPLLRGVSLDLEMPKTYGLMGETGCGKSTLIGLLTRFYDPAAGSVTLQMKSPDGVTACPLPEATLADWRANISLVLQEPSLFSGSIRDNILYSRPEATDEEVIQAAKHAAIHDDIMLMPNNYDTDVGYKGQALSGGQKQRVAIARALLRQPRLLLMDEATSALDNATEGRVEQGLKAACEANPMMVVSVAHRLTTIKDSDCIAVMEGGKLKEKGSHDELVALGGHYKERWDLFETANERQKTVEAYY